MVYRPKIDDELCFVLMPFTELHREYFRGIIQPATAAVGLRAVKADDIYGTAPIIRDIWQSIWSAKVVIADVTSKNPNVNYELGLCHALGVPAVLITQNLDDVPFDYRHLRCITYDTRRVDWQGKLRTDIILTLKAVLENASSDVLDDLAWPYDTELLRAPKKVAPFVPASEAQQAIRSGIALVRNAISRAFGPHGTTLSVSLAFGGDRSDRSGIFIASATESADAIESKGIEQVRSVAREVDSAVGDGVKTACLLFAEMVNGGYDALNGGSVLRDLVMGMDVAVEQAVFILVKNSLSATSQRRFAAARTATGGDSASAEIVENAISSAGEDGVIYMEDSPDTTSSLEVREGMYFDRGFLSPRFVTNEAQQLALLDDVRILLYPGKIGSMTVLLPILEQIARAEIALLVIAEDVEGEALETLIVNKERGTLRCAAVKAPGVGNKEALLEDIAVASGGRVLGRSTSALENAYITQLGKAKAVQISKDSTWIIGGSAERQLLETRAAGIRNQIAVATSASEVEKLRERLAKLVGRICAIKVGGISSMDVLERKYRIRTSLDSARSVSATGVIAGGGMGYWVCQGLIPTPSDLSQVAGAAVVRKALQVPLLTQIANANSSEAEVLTEIRESAAVTPGFNAEKRVVEDLDAAGVLDATRIVVRALQIAFVHARTVLQTGAWDLTQRAPSEITFPPRAIGGLEEI